MARLIPAFTDERTPPGEKDVFRMLASGPDDWVAIHSLDLAPWNRGHRTEIDFVVIVPDIGILCIEVKSHRSILFENDQWIPPDIRRSPFKQAADGRYSFYRNLSELSPGYKRVPVVHCCIFPNAPFPLRPNLAVQPWELIDGIQFRSFKTGQEFCAYLGSCMRRSIEADASLTPLSAPVRPADVARIVEFCAPVHKRRPGAREDIMQREKEAEHVLREQQRPVLRLAELNSRIVVEGPAGTGKTLIAMELAASLVRDGRRVALVCFNQLVGECVRQRATALSAGLPNLVAGRAIRLMADMAEITIPERPTSSFWDEELPAQIEERLTDPDFTATAAFDYLIVDEAQDLLARPRIWNCLTQFLGGGLRNGNFALFGDFSHQVLGDKSELDEQLAALLREVRPARWRLAENCRNYQVIGSTAVRLSGFDARTYSGYMRGGGTLSCYDIEFYRSPDEQAAHVRNWLAEFRAKGYRPGEIAILSFCAESDSIAARLIAEGLPLQQPWKQGEGTVHSTIHAFKGLERKVILLTDLAPRQSDFHRHLFYTGMTRAVEEVRILCHEGAKEVLVRWLKEGDEE